MKKVVSAVIAIIFLIQNTAMAYPQKEKDTLAGISLFKLWEAKGISIKTGLIMESRLRAIHKSILEGRTKRRYLKAADNEAVRSHVGDPKEFMRRYPIDYNLTVVDNEVFILNANVYKDERGKTQQILFYAPDKIPWEVLERYGVETPEDKEFAGRGFWVVSIPDGTSLLPDEVKAREGFGIDLIIGILADIMSGGVYAFRESMEADFKPATADDEIKGYYDELIYPSSESEWEKAIRAVLGIMTPRINVLARYLDLPFEVEEIVVEEIETSVGTIDTVLYLDRYSDISCVFKLKNRFDNSTSNLSIDLMFSRDPNTESFIVSKIVLEREDGERIIFSQEAEQRSCPVILSLETEFEGGRDGLYQSLIKAISGKTFFLRLFPDEIEDEAVQEYIRIKDEALNAVCEVLDIDNVPFHHLIIEETDDVNAYCLPGNVIGVTTGLLKRTHHSDTLFAVFAHEIAHSIKDHISKRKKRMKEAETVRDIAVTRLQYSRAQENEADAIAINALLESGRNPYYISFFDTNLDIQRATDPNSSVIFTYIKTHPDSGVRAIIEEQAALRNGFSRPEPIGMDKLDTAVQKVDKKGMLLTDEFLKSVTLDIIRKLPEWVNHFETSHASVSDPWEKHNDITRGIIGHINKEINGHKYAFIGELTDRQKRQFLKFLKRGIKKLRNSIINLSVLFFNQQGTYTQVALLHLLREIFTIDNAKALIIDNSFKELMTVFSELLRCDFLEPFNVDLQIGNERRFSLTKKLLGAIPYLSFKSVVPAEGKAYASIMRRLKRIYRNYSGDPGVDVSDMEVFFRYFARKYFGGASAIDGGRRGERKVTRDDMDSFNYFSTYVADWDRFPEVVRFYNEFLYVMPYEEDKGFYPKEGSAFGSFKEVMCWLLLNDPFRSAVKDDFIKKKIIYFLEQGRPDDLEEILVYLKAVSFDYKKWSNTEIMPGHTAPWGDIFEKPEESGIYLGTWHAVDKGIYDEIIPAVWEKVKSANAYGQMDARGKIQFLNAQMNGENNRGWLTITAYFEELLKILDGADRSEVGGLVEMIMRVLQEETRTDYYSHREDKDVSSIAFLKGSGLFGDWKEFVYKSLNKVYTLLGAGELRSMKELCEWLEENYFVETEAMNDMIVGLLNDFEFDEEKIMSRLIPVISERISSEKTIREIVNIVINKRGETSLGEVLDVVARVYPEKSEKRNTLIQAVLPNCMITSSDEIEEASDLFITAQEEMEDITKKKEAIELMLTYIYENVDLEDKVNLILWTFFDFSIEFPRRVEAAINNFNAEHATNFTKEGVRGEIQNMSNRQQDSLMLRLLAGYKGIFSGWNMDARIKFFNMLCIEKIDNPRIRKVFTELFRSLETAEAVEIGLRLLRLINSDDASPVVFRKVLDAFGVIGRKIGQLLGTFQDFPENYRIQLTVLQDEASGELSLDIFARLRDALGENIEDAYEWIAPLKKEASIKQVFKAKRRSDGKLAAIGLKRETVAYELRRGISLFHKILDKLTEEGGGYYLRGRLLVEELEAELEQEVDFRNEAKSTINAAIRCRKRGSDVCVPKVNLSKEDLIETSWVEEGRKIMDIEDQALRESAAKKVIDEFVEQAVVDRKVHKDMHEGNVLIDKDGSVYVIDWNLIDLTEGRLDTLIRLVLSVMLRDKTGLLNALTNCISENEINPLHKEEIWKLAEGFKGPRKYFDEIIHFLNKLTDLGYKADFTFYQILRAFLYIDNYNRYISEEGRRGEAEGLPQGLSGNYFYTSLVKKLSSRIMRIYSEFIPGKDTPGDVHQQYMRIPYDLRAEHGMEEKANVDAGDDFGQVINSIGEQELNDGAEIDLTDGEERRTFTAVMVRQNEYILVDKVISSSIENIGEILRSAFSSKDLEDFSLSGRPLVLTIRRRSARLFGDCLGNRVMFMNTAYLELYHRMRDSGMEEEARRLLQVSLEHEGIHEKTGAGSEIEGWLQRRDIERLVELLGEGVLSPTGFLSQQGVIDGEVTEQIYRTYSTKYEVDEYEAGYIDLNSEYEHPVVFKRRNKEVILLPHVLSELRNAARLSKELNIELPISVVVRNGIATAVLYAKDKTRIAILTSPDTDTLLNNTGYAGSIDVRFSVLSNNAALILNKQGTGMQVDEQTIGLLDDMQAKLAEHNSSIHLCSSETGRQYGINAEKLRGLKRALQDGPIPAGSEWMSILSDIAACDLLATKYSSAHGNVGKSRKELKNELARDPKVEFIEIHRHPTEMPSPPSAMPRGGDINTPGFTRGELNGLILHNEEQREQELLYLFYEPDRSSVYSDMFRKFWRKKLRIYEDLKEVAMQAFVVRPARESKLPRAIESLAGTIADKLAADGDSVLNTIDGSLRSIKDSRILSELEIESENVSDIEEGRLAWEIFRQYLDSEGGRQDNPLETMPQGGSMEEVKQILRRLFMRKRLINEDKALSEENLQRLSQLSSGKEKRQKIQLSSIFLVDEVRRLGPERFSFKQQSGGIKYLLEKITQGFELEIINESGRSGGELKELLSAVFGLGNYFSDSTLKVVPGGEGFSPPAAENGILLLHEHSNQNLLNYANQAEYKVLIGSDGLQASVVVTVGIYKLLEKPKDEMWELLLAMGYTFKQIEQMGGLAGLMNLVKLPPIESVLHIIDDVKFERTINIAA